MIAVAAADGSLLGSVEGTVEGLIATEPRGTHGFGYDPVFRLPGRGCTMAELSPEEKECHQPPRACRGGRPRPPRRVVGLRVPGGNARDRPS